MNASLRNASVLIVDDTPKNIQLLGTVLKDTGYRVIVATNGMAALNILEKTKPDLILLDVMMPELSGFETCKLIKENENIKDIPIIFLTAKTEPEDVIKGFELGAVDYILKPFHANELLARVKTHLELKISKELIQTLLNFQKGIVIMTEKDQVLYANQAFLKLTETKTIEEFQEKFSSLMNYFDFLQENETIIELDKFRIKVKDGVNIGKIFLAQRNLVPGKTFSILNLTDITDFEAEKSTLEVKASTDNLTGLYNRNKFQELFNEVLFKSSDKAIPMSLLIFDIDHFKKINDTFGHNTGDKVLVEVTSTIKSQTRISDIFCRWGGEEFLLLLVGSQAEDAFKIAEKIRIQIENRSFIQNYKVTISIGVTQYKSGDALETSVAKADKALYSAKSNGRNLTVQN
jgi:two-component system, cell cycle response regulator